MEFKNIVCESEIGSFFYQVQTDVGAALFRSLMKRGPANLVRHKEKELGSDLFTNDKHKIILTIILILYWSSYRILKVN